MIPARYEKAEYKDVPKEIAKKFEKIRESKKGLFIHGNVGTGKTHIAYALKKQWDEENPYRTAIFWNTPDLLQNEKMDFDRDAYSKKRSLEKLKESKHLRS
jgi:DNA replication protein DnaC